MGGDEDEAGVVSITGTLICLVIDLKGDKKKILEHCEQVGRSQIVALTKYSLVLNYLPGAPPRSALNEYQIDENQTPRK